MNVLNRRITLLLAVVNLVVAGVLPAQDVSDEQINRAVAQKQVEAAQRQVEVETRSLVAAPAIPTPPNAPAASSALARAVSFKGSWPLGSGGTGSVLVIPTAELKMEELIATTEDMTVMSRIFEKNLEQAHIPTAHGSLFVSSHDPFAALLGAGGGAIQSMYLQGYAALFLMKVDFPLSPPPEVKEEKQAGEKQESDPVWEQVRRDMYEPQDTQRRKTEQPEEKYDAEKVENLKTTLVKALKHAANVRNLKQDELVILAVAGTGESAMIATRGEIVGHSRIVQQQPASSGSSQTVIVIRAKKSDIDSFAKNALDYEQFRQRIQLFGCPCLGAEAGRGDPFSRYF